MHFTGDEHGIHLVGDWPAEDCISPWVVGEASGHGALRATVKIITAESWALYRVTGATSSGELVLKRIRRGRAA